MRTVRILQRGVLFPNTSVIPGLRLINFNPSPTALINLPEPLLLHLLSYLDCWAAAWVLCSCTALQRAILDCLEHCRLRQVVATVGRGSRPSCFPQPPDYRSISEAFENEKEGIVAVRSLSPWTLESPILMNDLLELHAFELTTFVGWGLVGQQSANQVRNLQIADLTSLPPFKSMLAELLECFERFKDDDHLLNIRQGNPDAQVPIPSHWRSFQHNTCLFYSLRNVCPTKGYVTITRHEFDFVARNILTQEVEKYHSGRWKDCISMTSRE